MNNNNFKCSIYSSKYIVNTRIYIHSITVLYSFLVFRLHFHRTCSHAVGGCTVYTVQLHLLSEDFLLTL